MPRIAIIGAGPAGTAMAIALARGRAVGPGDILLVESSPFPRAKVCGEFISPAVSDLLIDLVGHRALHSAGAGRVDRLVIEQGDRSRTWTLPSPALTLSRSSLDTLLLRAARDEGVRILQPLRAIAVSYSTESAAVQCSDGTVVEADIVVHADGRGRLDVPGSMPTPMRAGVVALKCHFRPRQTIEGLRMRAAPGAYLGLVQVENGNATCALVCAKDLIGQHSGSADALLRELLPSFRPDLRTTDWLASGVADAPFQSSVHRRSFRIGNAAAAVEPVGGEGIGLALWSGACLAQVLTRYGVSPNGLHAASKEFGRAYRARLRLRRPACRLAAEALVRPRLTNSLWPALSMPRVTIAPWYACTGKPVFTHP